MFGRPGLAPTLLAAWAACLGVMAPLTDRGNRALAWPGTPEASADAPEPLPPGASFKRQKIGDGIYELTYGFKNFNHDKLSVSLVLVSAEVDGSLKEYGWTKAEADAAFSKGRTEAEARQKAAEYMASRGFRVIGRNEVVTDMPLMVRRNVKRVNGVAREIAREAAKRSYSAEEIIGAVTAMVQTSVAYKIPPDIDGSRHIAGVYPPPRTLLHGWGDCDTKTALIGSILANWDGMRAVGLSLPRHYLMGLARIPRQDDVFVEHNGTQYVLIESAGPAWLPPGTVGTETAALLESANGIPIQPF